MTAKHTPPLTPMAQERKLCLVMETAQRVWGSEPKTDALGESGRTEVRPHRLLASFDEL